MSSLAPLIRGPFAVWRVVVPAPDVVYVKGIFEASEGVGAVLAPPRAPRAPRASGGELVIVAPSSLADEAAGVLSDLQAELGDRMRAEAVCPDGASRSPRARRFAASPGASGAAPGDGCVAKSDPLA